MTDTATSPTPVEDLLERARAYVIHSHAKNTLDAYAADWKHFNTWCDTHKQRAFVARVRLTRGWMLDKQRHAINVLSVRRVDDTLGTRVSTFGADTACAYAPCSAGGVQATPQRQSGPARRSDRLVHSLLRPRMHPHRSCLVGRTAPTEDDHRRA